MAEEPFEDGKENNSGTSINDLLEEVERLLREVEEKEALEEEKEHEKEKAKNVKQEIKEIIEEPSKTRNKKKEVKQDKEDKEKEIELEIEKEINKVNKREKKIKKIFEVTEPIQEVEEKQEEKIIVENKKEIKEVEVKEVKAEVEKEEKNKKEKKEKEENVVKEPIIEKDASTDLITIKGESKELTISLEQLEKIENEIRKQKDIPKQDRDMINKEIFKNVIKGVMIVFYFMVLIIGFFKLKEETFLGDVRIFSGMLIATTIFIFEKAYRKESIDKMVLGIEILVLSIVTLLTSYIYGEHIDKFPYILNSISMIFATYYVGKSIVTYVKMKKKVMKKISDIRNIINRSK